MCDPATAALALSAGGTILQTQEANRNARRVQNAKNEAYAQGIQRQNQFAAEAQAQLANNIESQGRDAFDQQFDQATDKSEQLFRDAAIDNQGSYNLAPSAPKNLQIEHQLGDQKATQTANRDATNLARLSGYGDAMFNQGLQNNDFRRGLGVLTDTARRDANLINLDISQAANNANKAPSLFPQLLSAGGSALGMYSAANGIETFGGSGIEASRPAGGFVGPMPQTDPGLFRSLQMGLPF